MSEKRRLHKYITRMLDFKMKALNYSFFKNIFTIKWVQIFYLMSIYTDYYFYITKWIFLTELYAIVKRILPNKIIKKNKKNKNKKRQLQRNALIKDYFIKQNGDLIKIA